MAEYSSQSSVTIALDVMGGDYGPKSVIPGANLVYQKNARVNFLLFGHQDHITPYLSQYPDLEKVCRIVHTEKMVANDEKPSVALRSSRDTSMRMAIEAVKEGKAQAVVSAGNTGALMAMAKMILEPLPGIHRPAIASVFPGRQGDTIMLDLGANVLVDAENLVQFAVLGSIFAKAHKNIQSPSVGLLNVGSEKTKGPDHIRGADEILSKIDFPGQYTGFVEGTDLMTSAVDVIVSDGYAGNIALKTAEGVSKFAKDSFKDSMQSDPLAMLGALLSYFALKRFKQKMDPRLYNGGVFLGLNGLCVKSHGGADDLGFSSAILLALRLAHHGYIKKVAEELNNLLHQDSFLSQSAYHE